MCFCSASVPTYRSCTVRLPRTAVLIVVVVIIIAINDVERIVKTAVDLQVEASCRSLSERRGVLRKPQ
jgi:hypothetical protein